MIESLHNLLPRTGLQRLRVAYYTRIGSVALFGFASVVCVGMISLVPAYVALNTEHGALVETIAYFEEMRVREGNQTKTLENIRGRVQEVGRYLGPFAGSGYIDVVNARAPAGISLRTIKYDQVANTLLVQGTAETRSDFVTFTQTLEKESVFTNVTFPVSDLAPSTELTFTITMQIATTTPPTI